MITPPSLQTKFSIPSALAALALLSFTSLCGCTRSHTQAQNVTQACEVLSRNIGNQENSFVIRVQTIRGQHILMREYDRQMIAVLEQRRAAIQAAVLTDASLEEGVAGCSGGQLETLRINALQEMTRLQGYLNTFKQGLQEDPAGVFIDSH
jgi:hypothetical protein